MLDLISNGTDGSYIFSIYVNGLLIDTKTLNLSTPFYTTGNVFTVNSTILAGIILGENEIVEWVIKRSCSSTTKIIKYVYHEPKSISSFVNIPSGAFMNSWAPDATFPPKYRIQDGVLYLVGLVSKSLTFPLATGGTFNSAIIDLSLLTGYSTIKSVVAGSVLDYLGTRDVIFTNTTMGAGQYFLSTNRLYVEYTHTTSGSAFTSTRQLGLGNIAI